MHSIECRAAAGRMSVVKMLFSPEVPAVWCAGRHCRMRALPEAEGDLGSVAEKSHAHWAVKHPLGLIHAGSGDPVTPDESLYWAPD
jgi:hypothetical protein